MFKIIGKLTRKHGFFSKLVNAYSRLGKYVEDGHLPLDCVVERNWDEKWRVPGNGLRSWKSHLKFLDLHFFVNYMSQKNYTILYYRHAFHRILIDWHCLDMENGLRTGTQNCSGLRKCVLFFPSFLFLATFIHLYCLPTGRLSSLTTCKSH